MVFKNPVPPNSFPPANIQTAGLESVGADVAGPNLSLLDSATFNGFSLPLDLVCEQLKLPSAVHFAPDAVSFVDENGKLRPSPFTIHPEAQSRQTTANDESAKVSVEPEVNTRLTAAFHSKALIVASGSYGTAMASVLARNGIDVLLYVRDPEVARSINENNIHPRLGTEIELPPSIRATTDLKEGLQDRGLIFLAAPAKYLGEVAARIVPHSEAIVVNLAKGFVFEGECPFPSAEDFANGPRTNDPTVLLPLQLLERIPHWQQCQNLVTLAGAGFAEHIAKGGKVTLDIASKNAEARDYIQNLLQNTAVTIEKTRDTSGLQIAGAAKNYIALAVGMFDGALDSTKDLETYGETQRAQLISHLLAESRKLYAIEDGRPVRPRNRTFMSEAIHSDILMCSARDSSSRNYRAGYMIGRGDSLSEVVEELGTVEGLANAWAAKLLGDAVTLGDDKKPSVRSTMAAGPTDSSKYLQFLPAINTVVDVLTGERPFSELATIGSSIASLRDKTVRVGNPNGATSAQSRFVLEIDLTKFSEPVKESGPAWSPEQHSSSADLPQDSQ